MDIAILVRNLYPPRGAEESMYYVKNKLEKEHNVRIFGFIMDKNNLVSLPANSTAKKKPIFSSSPLPIKAFNDLVKRYRLAYYFKSELERYSPDLILAQHELCLLAAWFGLTSDTQTIAFIRDEYQLSLPDYDEGALVNFFRYMKSAIDWRVNQKMFDSVDAVIANSNYMADRYSERYSDLDPYVVYPFVDVEQYRVMDTGEKILHVTPEMHKGINITLDVAEKLPQEEFIIVGEQPKQRIAERITNLTNVEYIGYVDDMKTVYRDTKLVLMPSKWEEAFGRIPIEAGISGIPTLGSSAGGLPEAIGIDDLIVDSNSPSDYAYRIKEICENYEYYSYEVAKNAEKKSADKQYSNLENIISSLF